MSSVVERCVLCYVLLLASVSSLANVHTVPILSEIVPPFKPAVLDEAAAAAASASHESRPMTVELDGVPASKTLIRYTIHDNLRNARARYEDPFGGCRLRCPSGFDSGNYHIHMHKKHRPVIKGGRDPVRGIWHQDWKERAD